MDHLLKTTGLLTLIALLTFGAYYTYTHYEQALTNFFLAFGVLCFVGGLIYAGIRWRYGKGWPLKLPLGKGLSQSVEQMLQEIDDPQQKVQRQTVAEVITQIIYRLTRIGVVGLLIAGIPLVLLWQQNVLFRKQNEKIDVQTELFKVQNEMFSKQNEKVDLQLEKLEDQNALITDQNTNVATQTKLFQDQNRLVGFQNQRLSEQIDLMETQNERLNLQNNLIEADRRSSLVFLMSNILDKVDEEIREQRDTLINKPGFVEDSMKYKLSKPLISRIMALSRAFKPYRVMQGDTLSKELQSPERGQLFRALMENNLDSSTQNTIISNGNFSNAVIGKINLREADFRYAFLIHVLLNLADLSYANLGYSMLNYADLRYADLRHSDLRDATLIGTHLRGANLHEADLSNAGLTNADLRFANLSNANLSGAGLFEANLLEANLLGTKNLTKEQLLNVKTLYQCKNLDPKIEQQLRAEKPCLFEDPDGPNACPGK